MKEKKQHFQHIMLCYFKKGKNTKKDCAGYADGTMIECVTSGLQGFSGGSVVKSLPANAGDVGSIPGLGGSHML